MAGKFNWGALGAVVSIMATFVGATWYLASRLQRIESSQESEFKTMSTRFSTFDTTIRTLRESQDTLDDQLSHLAQLVDSLGARAARLEPASRLSEQQEAARVILQDIRRRLPPEGTEPLPRGFYDDVTSRLRTIEERLSAIARRVGVPEAN